MLANSMFNNYSIDVATPFPSLNLGKSSLACPLYACSLSSHPVPDPRDDNNLFVWLELNTLY